VSHTMTIPAATSSLNHRRQQTAGAVVKQPWAQKRQLAQLDAIIARVPFLDLTIEHTELFDGTTRVLLAQFPHWREEEIVLVQCKDGITNKLLKCTHRASGETVLVRSYGQRSDLIIDRKQEIVNLVCLGEAGLCPRLHGRFHNGLVYDYLPGRVFTSENMRDAAMGAQVAILLARWHQMTNVPGDKSNARLFPTLWRWFHAVRKLYASEERLAKVAADGVCVEQIELELCELQSHIEALDPPVVFCHNDLLSANILYDDETDRVAFIDYEYGGYNYRGFDIANHFNEWAGFECDWSLVPDQTQQRAWISAYFAADVGAVACDACVDPMLREVARCMLASHLFWGLWALVQAELSNIDFNYFSYGVARIQAYYANKHALLSV